MLMDDPADHSLGSDGIARTTAPATNVVITVAADPLAPAANEYATIEQLEQALWGSPLSLEEIIEEFAPDRVGSAR